MSTPPPSRRLDASAGLAGPEALLAGFGLGVRRGQRWLLRDVWLQVAAGEMVALLGPNGAGKTTLLRVLAGEEQAHQGQVRLDGRPLESWPPRELARTRAVLSQSSALEFPFTAFEVVLLGRLPHVEQRESSHDHAVVRAAMSAVGVEHLAGRLYPTLSGGERQRVHLARVLAQLAGADDDRAPTPAAKILLLDEPTSNLDPAHQHATLALARQCADEGGAVLVVLHDVNLAAAYADRLALLRDGQLLACGPPAEVLTSEVLWQVFEVNAELVPHPTLPVPLIVTTGAGRSPPPRPGSNERKQA